MPRRTRQSPLQLQDPKIHSAAAADRGVPPPPMEGAAASTPQAHHLPRSPSFIDPRTPQRHGRCSIPSVAAAAAAAPSHARALDQSRATCPAATSATSSGPPHRAARGPLNPRQQAAAVNTPSSAAAPNTTPPSLQVHSTPPPAQERGSRSYAEAVRGRAKPNQSPYDSLVHLLFDYLFKFAIIRSEMTANYGNNGPIITVSGDLWKVWIPQGHLSEYDQELSCAVFNHDRFEELLYPAVSHFLIRKRFVNNAVGGMNATFYTIPPSTKTLEDFVREQGPLVSMRSIFDGNFELCVASDIGMMLVHGFLVYIFSVHKKGHTWNGGFSTGDMVVVVGNCMTCTINKISSQGKPHCRTADLQKIAEIFKPMFTINEEMALYFNELQKDLSKVNNGEVEAKWYRVYLLSHPALQRSTARSSLVSGLHHAVDTSKANGDPIPSVLREGSDWMAIIPPRNSEVKSCTDYCLREVFWFNDKPNSEDFSPFAPTVEALLRYKRNFLQHGQKHIKLQDHTELELFLAKTFPLALPNILWGLLSRNEMNGPFKGHWEEYCSFRIGNDCNTEGRTGILISFCVDGRSGGKV